MQIDFHYCVVKVLAIKSGLAESEAQTIAYASQFVDDAVDSRKIRLLSDPEIDYPRYTDKYFDPVRTAHEGFQFLKALKKAVQRKVYISFHFIPPEIYNSKHEFEYRTCANAPLARRMVTYSIEQLHKCQPYERTQKLIKLGIALHSYADTWAHQGFSGRLNSKDNNIERIELWKNRQWSRLPFLEQLEYNAFPNVGHAEAFHFPDQSFRVWRYRHCHSNEVVERSNTEIFMEAAYHIYHLLAREQEQAKEWNTFSNKLLQCFSYETTRAEKKFSLFRTVFPDIEFNYQPHQWRNTAIQQMLRRRPRLHRSRFREKFDFAGDKKWFYFHAEAFKQRLYIMRRIPKNLRKSKHD